MDALEITTERGHGSCAFFVTEPEVLPGHNYWINGGYYTICGYPKREGNIWRVPICFALPPEEAKIKPPRQLTKLELLQDD